MQAAPHLELVPDEITTASGAVARSDGNVIEVRSPTGRLVATYDAERDALSIEGAAHLELSTAKSITIDTEALRMRVGSYELSAGRIVERSTDVFRTVERLLETRAKRARTIVDRLLELSARRTSITSEEDTRVDGKRVLLG